MRGRAEEGPFPLLLYITYIIERYRLRLPLLLAEAVSHAEHLRLGLASRPSEHALSV